jgi:hypothetical protein
MMRFRLPFSANPAVENVGRTGGGIAAKRAK